MVSHAGGVPSDGKSGAEGPLPTEITIGGARISIGVSPAPPKGSQLNFELLDIFRKHPANAGTAGSSRDFLRLALDWPTVKETASGLSGEAAAASTATPV